MDQQSSLQGATVLPARPPGGVPPTPPRLAASSRHIPTAVWSRHMSCPSDQDGALDCPPALSLNLASSDNYTFAAHHVAAPAGTSPRPYHFDSSSLATPHSFLRPGHFNIAAPPRLPDVAAEACGAASPREPASPSGSQGGGLTQASTPSTVIVSRARLGDDSETEITDPLKPVPNPNAVVHAIQNSSVPDGPRNATAVVACHRPRTHPAGSAQHPTDTPGNHAGYSSQSGPGSHDSHHDGEHNDDNDDRESDDQREEDGEEERGGAGNTNKRQTQPAPNGPLNCPYRRRNNQRFNVRDHAKCTNTFEDVSALKAHVRKFHLRETPPLQQGNQTENVEDGITEWISDRLRDRKGHLKVRTWDRLWRILFPGDREVPSAAYEPCIKMATDEFMAIADTARLCAKEDVLAHVSDLLQRHCGCLDSDAMATTDSIDKIYEERLAHGLRGFEHKILVAQNPPARAAVAGPSRSRSKRSNQHGNQGNHGSESQIPSIGTSSQHGEQQVSLRHLAPLAPSPVRGDNTLAPPSLGPYPPHDMPHQQQGHVPNTFPTARDTGYQEWAAQTTSGTAAFVASRPDQYGFQPAHMPPPSHWMGDSSAAHQFHQSPAAGNYPAPHPRPIATHASQQHSHPSSLPGAPEARQHAPLAYGPHASSHSRHSGFVRWRGNNSTTDHSGNQDLN